jgi:FtsH-binding integral membrane protein
VQIFKKKTTAKGVALAHGAFAAAGLITLVLYTAKNPSQLLWIAVTILVIAALGGLILFINDIRGKTGPVGLVIVHALAAVAAVIIVLVIAIR